MNAHATTVSSEALALAANNEAVLRALLAAPIQGAAAVAKAAGVDPKNIDRALSRMLREGLVETLNSVPKGWEITRTGRLALQAVDLANGRLAPPAAGPGADADNDTIMLLHHHVRPNPLNPRRIDLTRDRDRRELDELKASIVSAGDVYNNLVVFPADEDGVHVLSAGERRWRAVGELIEEGFWPRDRRLRAIQKPHSEGQTSFIALVENKQRADLPILEEARAWKTLIDETPGLSARAAALKVGRDPRTVQQMLQVLREGTPENIARCEDPDDDYTWEDLRRSVQQPTEQGDGDDGAQQVDLEEAVAEAGAPTWRDRIEHFSAAVQAAALAEARAVPGHERIVATPLSGLTTIEGETWPSAPTETLKTPWEEYPQAEIELSMSDKGRWYAALRTQAGGPSFSGQSGPWQVYTRDALFRSRADVLAYAAEAIVKRLGDVWGKKRKLQDWLAEIQKPPLRPMSEGFPPARLPLVEMQAKFLATEPRLIVRGRPAVRIDYWRARSDSLFRGMTNGYNSGGPFVGAENLRGGGTCAFITEHGEEWLRQNGWWLTPETVAEQLAVWREDTTWLHANTAAQLAATGWITDWLVEPQPQQSAGSPGEASPAEDAAPQRELSSVEALALLELVHAAGQAHDAGIDHGEGWVRAGKYWNDATFHQLKTLGLADVTHAFTDDGPHVRVLDAGMARLGDEFPMADLEAIESEDLDAAREACGITEWAGPGYVTPWLNRDAGEAVDAARPADAEPDEDAPGADAEDAAAVAILAKVNATLQRPHTAAEIAELLGDVGLRRPFGTAGQDGVAWEEEAGIVYDVDADEAAVADSNGSMPHAMAAARAELIAYGLNLASGGDAEREGEPAWVRSIRRFTEHAITFLSNPDRRGEDPADVQTRSDVDLVWTLASAARAGALPAALLDIAILNSRLSRMDRNAFSEGFDRFVEFKNQGADDGKPLLAIYAGDLVNLGSDASDYRVEGVNEHGVLQAQRISRKNGQKYGAPQPVPLASIQKIVGRAKAEG